MPSPSADPPDADDAGRRRAYSLDNRTYAVKGPGRMPVTGSERTVISILADRLPLFG